MHTRGILHILFAGLGATLEIIWCQQMRAQLMSNKRCTTYRSPYIKFCLFSWCENVKISLKFNWSMVNIKASQSYKVKVYYINPQHQVIHEYKCTTYLLSCLVSVHFPYISVMETLFKKGTLIRIMQSKILLWKPINMQAAALLSSLWALFQIVMCRKDYSTS